MPHADWKILLDYPVAIPSERILTQFNEITEAIIAEIQNLIFRNRNLRRTRDLLLPRLIAGEVDVAELEVAS